MSAKPTHLPVAVWVLLLAAASAPAQSQPTRAPDEALWSQISAIQARPTPGADYAAQMAAYRQRCRDALEKTRLYLSLYPGGTHRDEAVRLELEMLFEIGSLDGGDYEALRARVNAFLNSPTSSATTRAEAAYWQIVLARLAPGPFPDSQPATRVTGDDPHLLAAYAKYVRTYPTGRFVPRMCQLLFADAERQGRTDRMRQIVEQLERDFPHHLTTEQLAGALRLHEQIGKPFPLESITAPEPVEIQPPKRGVVLIVVWSSDEAALAVARRVEAFRLAHPGVTVIGLNVDSSREQFQQGVAALRANWPQHWHELGRAGPFCRQWGIRRVPTVLVLGPGARLVGAFVDDGWEKAAEEAVAP